MGMKKRSRKRIRSWLLLVCGIILTGCQKETETLVTTESLTEERIEQESTEEKQEIDWTENIFAEESVFISYPVFSFQESVDAEGINQRIQEDALRVLEYFDVNIESDTLDITYEIADITKEWISIVYCGSYSRADAAYPTEVKYTSNLSLIDGQHLRLSQMESAAEAAQKIREGKYRVIGEEEERNAAVREWVEGIAKEDLIQSLEAADFGTESYESYPEWFSFWSTIEGKTQISIVMPVIHALGDYAVLEIFLE